MICIWKVPESLQLTHRGTQSPIDLGFASFHAAFCALNEIELSQTLQNELDHGNDQNVLNDLGYKEELKDLLSLLRLHVGIGSGILKGYHVGGVLNRWEYFVTGMHYRFFIYLFFPLPHQKKMFDV